MRGLVFSISDLQRQSFDLVQDAAHDLARGRLTSGLQPFFVTLSRNQGLARSLKDHRSVESPGAASRARSSFAVPAATDRACTGRRASELEILDVLRRHDLGRTEHHLAIGADLVAAEAAGGEAIPVLAGDL